MINKGGNEILHKVNSKSEMNIKCDADDEGVKSTAVKKKKYCFR